MKYALIVVLMCHFWCEPVLAQNSGIPENAIFWSDDYNLVWTDFEGLADENSQSAAFSVIGFENRLNYNDEQYRAVIQVYFDKNESWNKAKTANLLQHEQGHFDLAEIAARKFRKKIQEKMQADAMSEKEFRRLNSETEQALKKVQEQYDEATNFSRDYKAQLKWTERIKKELFEYSAYADPEIVIKR